MELLLAAFCYRRLGSFLLGWYPISNAFQGVVFHPTSSLSIHEACFAYDIPAVNLSAQAQIVGGAGNEKRREFDSSGIQRRGIRRGVPYYKGAFLQAAARRGRATHYKDRQKNDHLNVVCRKVGQRTRKLITSGPMMERTHGAPVHRQTLWA
jgi:hypothetical protein